MNNPFSIRSGMGIRNRIFLLLLIVFVPLLIIYGLIFFQWFQERKQEEMRANLELARAVAKNFETFLQGMVHSELSVGLALTASQPLTDQDRKRLFDQFQAANPAIRTVFWLNSSGLVLASSLPSFIGFNFHDRSYFQRVKEGRDWAVSELILGRVTGKPAFTVSRGIRNEQGELLGVLATAIEPDRLDHVLGIPRFEEAGVSLLDNKGMHVYRYPPTPYTWEQRNWLKVYPVMENALQGWEVVATVVSGRTGMKRLAAFAPVSSIGWVVSCSRAEHEVIAGIVRTLLPQAVFMFFFALAVFGAAVGLSRTITVPILKLTKHAAALGSGKTGQLEIDTGPGELKKLAETFNEMGEKISLREASLKESESRYRTLFENANDAVVVADPSGKGMVLSANPSACRMFGYTPEEIIQLDRERMIDMTDERVQALLQRRDETGHAASTLLYKRKDGSTFHGEVSTSSFYDHSGQRRSVAIIRDITERLQAHQALQRAAAELELRAVELKQANKELEVFAYTISHDLRTPLRVISSYAQLLLKRTGLALDEEGRRRLEAIERNALKMGQLISDLLDLSRVGRTTLTISRIDMNSLVKEVLETLTAADTDGKAKISVAALPAAQGDPVLIQQAVANLLGNAIKFSKNRPEPRIEVGSLEQNGETIYYIRDNGIGFDMANYNKLFGTFNRLVDEKEFEGTGLGLAIVDRVITRHGGRVWAEGKEREGACFYFTLPAVVVRS